MFRVTDTTATLKNDVIWAPLLGTWFRWSGGVEHWVDSKEASGVEEEEGEKTVASIYMAHREPLFSVSGMVAEMVAHNVAGFMDATMQDACT